MEAHELSISVSGTPLAAAETRRQIAAEIRSWNTGFDADTLHSAELVAGELIANAVQHASDGPVSVAARLSGTALRIEVCDSSSKLPSPSLPDTADESGRGLFIVAALADHCGVEPTPSGKRCWAEITVSRESSGSHAPDACPAPRAHLPLQRR
ncbi:ATP-binding protein [Streptomyces sp. NBC_01142]|uniref:ATP-binding protein n=1 Tax=Streptomyces sp. NBC_01142 TaxID=2975865 RepID=UPI0022533370|nr:ATP-binding protein [Streptomyces sp. NBC_01142]MCX4822449.1 ATP-binding protein [Streptomyces sp. NBC_01142]